MRLPKQPVPGNKKLGEIWRLESIYWQARAELAEAALRNITVGECENFTSGIGSCYRLGRTTNAKYTADKCCNSCIASAALAEIAASES